LALHLGEAGLAVPINYVSSARNFAPEADRQNWSARDAMETFASRLRLVTRQLKHSPYLAGQSFTAADISVTYALMLARRNGGVDPGEAEQAYMVRTSGREAYKRALESCESTKAWLAQSSGV
jgi:glutathione S-transferase